MEYPGPFIVIVSINKTFRNLEIRLQLFVKEITNFIVTVIMVANIFIKNYSYGFISKNKKNRMEIDDKSSNFEIERLIAALEQKKTRAKSSLTRTRQKFEKFLNEELPSRCEVKQFQMKIDRHCNR